MMLGWYGIPVQSFTTPARVAVMMTVTVQEMHGTIIPMLSKAEPHSRVCHLIVMSCHHNENVI
jgi:hypothetical protein